MVRWRRSGVLGLWLLLGCSGGGEAKNAAEPHSEEFYALRVRAMPLAQMRRELRRQQALFEAFQSDAPAPAGLEAELAELREGRVTLSQENIDRARDEFERRFQTIFAESEDVLHAELVFIEEDESTTYLYPEHAPLPVTDRWHALSQQRTFCALADCTVGRKPVPCVVLQLRPRPYPGNVGLSVAFARE